MLSAAERERAQRRHRERDRRRVVIRRAVLRRLLGGYLDLPARDVPLEVGANGKPICPAAPRLAFNCSSSNGVAVYAFASDCALGVDVEHRPDGTWEEFPVARYLSGPERERLRDLPGEIAIRNAARAWAAKEAVAKAVGVGLSLPIRELELDGDSTSPRVTMAGGWLPHASPDWSVRFVADDDHRVAAIACDSPIARVVESEWTPAPDLASAG